jgi:cytochrome c oxidase cbb3-type subunit I/II
MQTLGVPYPDGYDEQALADLEKQAAEIASNLKASGIEVKPTKDIIAMIAYLQRIGTDINAEKE